MEFTLQNPLRTSGAIICDIGPFTYPSTLSKSGIYRQLVGLQSLNIENGKISYESIKSKISTLIGPAAPFFLTNIVKSEDTRSGYKWRCNLAAICSEYANMIDWIPTKETHTPYRGKVRVIAGLRSDFVMGKEMGGYLEWFPGMDLERDVRWVDAGHWLHAEKPKEFIEEVEGFIG